MAEALRKATGAWGEPLPDWVRALAEACDRRSQNKVAQDLGYSGAAISQVLKASYPGNLARLEAAVRAHLLAQTVACPVLGEVARERCLNEQRRPFAATSSLRARLYRACRSCPNNVTDQIHQPKEGKADA